MPDIMRSFARLHSTSSGFIGKILIVGGGNIVSRVLGFLFPIILTWTLGQQDYGFIRYVMATTTLLGQVLISGYPTALTRYIGKYSTDPQRQTIYFTNNLCANVVLLLVVIAGLIPLMRYLNKFHWEVVMVLIGAVIDYTFFAILRGYLLSTEMAIYTVSSKALQIVVLLAVYFLSGHMSPQFALAVYSFANLPPLVYVLACTQLDSKFKLNLISLHTIWEVTRFAAPLLANAIAYGILMGFDSFLIETYRGLEEVAVYNAAKTLTIVFSFVPFAVSTILMPTIASSRSRETSKEYIGFSLLASALTGLGLVGLFFFFGGPIANLMFPAAYSEAARLVVWLAVGAAVFYLYSILSQTWIGLGKPYVPAAFLSLVAVANVGLNVLLVPSMGAEGAAVAFLASCSLGLAGLGLLTINALRKSRVTAC